MATVQTVIDIVRAQTNQDVPRQAMDGQLIMFTDLDYQFVRRRAALAVPTLFTKNKTFTLTANSQDLTAAPASISDLERISRVEVQVGADFQKVDVALSMDPELSDAPAYLERGSSIDFYPSSYSMVGKTIKVTYLSKGLTLTAAGNPLDFPAGLENIVAERVAARVRRRMFESDVDPNNVGLEALKEEIKDLRKRYKTAAVPGFTPGRRS